MRFNVPEGCTEIRLEAAGTYVIESGDTSAWQWYQLAWPVLNDTGLEPGTVYLSGEMLFVNQVPPSIYVGAPGYTVPAGMELVLVSMSGQPFNIYGERGFRILSNGLPVHGAADVRFSDCPPSFSDTHGYGQVSLNVTIPPNAVVHVQAGLHPNLFLTAGEVRAGAVLRGYLRPIAGE